MTVGRKRLNRKLHVVRATDQPCRRNESAPEAPGDSPKPAIELQPVAERWYSVIRDRLEAMGIASSVDSELVMLLAMRLAEVEELTGEIKAQGSTYAKIELIKVPGEDGRPVIKAQRVIKANPAVAQRSEAMRHAQSLLSEFGLSPASRSKVSAGAGSSEGSRPFDPFEALIN